MQIFFRQCTFKKKSVIVCLKWDKRGIIWRINIWTEMLSLIEKFYGLTPQAADCIIRFCILLQCCGLWIFFWQCTLKKKDLNWSAFMIDFGNTLCAVGVWCVSCWAAVLCDPHLNLSMQFGIYLQGQVTSTEVHTHTHTHLLFDMSLQSSPSFQLKS